MSTVPIIFTLFALAVIVEKEVMRKVRKFRFQTMLTEENLLNLENSGDVDYRLDKKQAAPAGD